MIKYILTFCATIAFTICAIGQLAFEIGSNAPKTIQVSIASSGDYLNSPFNFFNNSNFTIKFPIALNPIPMFSIVGSSTINYLVDDISVDGGDGFLYQKFSNIGTSIFPIGDGQTIEVAVVTITGDYTMSGEDVSEMFSLVPHTIDAFIETSMENFLGEQITNAADVNTEVFLPIKLTDFFATKGNNLVNLKWFTATEKNGSHFAIERSRDGIDNWVEIGQVKAVGESNTKQEYAFVDNKLPLGTRGATKTFFYRLNMVDNDASQEYSQIRTVRFDQEAGSFIVYPNPTNNEVFVNLSDITEETGEAKMNIFNLDGQVVKQVVLPTNDDIRVDISNMHSGIYYFVVKQGEDMYTQKVIKID